jgi:hypothetical protein
MLSSRLAAAVADVAARRRYTTAATPASDATAAAATAEAKTRVFADVVSPAKQDNAMNLASC